MLAYQISGFTIIPSFALPDPYSGYDAPKLDTIPLSDRVGDYITDGKNNPFDIKPKNLDQKVEYDPVSGHYIIYEKIGDIYYRTPSYMTFDEYMDYEGQRQEKNYFNNLAGIKSEKKSKSGIIDPLDRINLENSLIDRLFGGSEVNINPQGNVDVSIGMLYTSSKNPNLLRPTFFNIDFPNPVIKMSVDGKIGTKMNLNFNYDTQSSFDFDREIKLGFNSGAFSDDDIIKTIEAGNVSLPLRGNLIQGAQSLFGLKTQLQFGRLFLTGIVSYQRSKANNVKIENGVSVQDFEIYPDEYDENRHFFIAHYNRDTYERSLRDIPYIGSSHQIAQIEVWISDDRPEFQDNATMVAAIADLGEPEPKYFTSSQTVQSVIQSKDEQGILLPKNGANSIYSKLSQYNNINDVDKVNTILKTDFGMKQSTDFEVFRGRRLSPSEYTYHPKLGTISLNSRLRPNQVLGVAYNYYYTTICDTLFQVGQLSASSVLPSNQTDTINAEPPKVHFVKLLKPTNQLTSSPMWDLMMKNVYPLRTTQLNPHDFEFDIYYEDDFSDGSLKKYIPEQDLRYLPLLQLFNLDRLNRYSDRQADGYFDYVSGVTVIERSGSIVFPVLEPFGSNLSLENFEKLLNRDLPDSLENVLANKYRYQSLYDSIVVLARQKIEKNKFVMKGRVKSSSNNGEIPLGPFVPQGSVRVTAGSKTLIEGQDYEIDYSLGRLRIINETYLAQGTPINVSFEDNSVFNLQNKSMLGLRAEYVLNKKNSIGATFLKLKERPFSTKVNVGDDPINNTIYGLDYNYSNKAPWITKLVDKLPFYSTTQESNINFIAEAALIRPGHSKAINTSVKKDGEDVEENSGIANIDDFEGAISTFNLGGLNPNNWVLSSTPTEFKESSLDNQLIYGANRARINWYTLDQGIAARSSEDNIDPYTRLMSQTNLFPLRPILPGQNLLFTFDISYYPTERGPYNFDSRGGYSGYTSGFDVADDKIVLRNPSSRWGGITRTFQNSDFETANYESIEFWMLNPFIDSRNHMHANGEEGEFVINLGSVSEDILKDNLLYFENANPTTQRQAPTTKTAFGRATISIPLVNGFDVSEGSSQDIGFDGINDAQEQTHYSSWLNENNLTMVPEVMMDPSNDNFIFFNDQKFAQETNILNRFKEYNGPEGNAPLDRSSNQNVASATSFIRGNNLPETEDLNNNRTLDVNESYYEYRLKLRNKNGQIDTSNLQYFRQVTVSSDSNLWYRFQIPIRQVTPNSTIGNIEGFRNIQFMRMYMKGFESSKTFRLAEFQLQRSIWRKQEPLCDGQSGTPASKEIDFVIDDVGLEENGAKLPFNYRVPEGVSQTRVFAANAEINQDEKSMALRFKNLSPDCEVSVSKLARLNMVVYKRLQMFVHAEHALNKPELEDGDLTLLVRLGKDFVNNYYEYRLPLKMSKVKDGQTASNIWKNFINIPLDSLLELKRTRIKNSLAANEYVSGTINSAKNDEVLIVGNPSLGLVKVVQVGVINTSSKGEQIDGEIWLNELRVVGFDEKGGVAAQSKIQIQMADLGEINASTNYSSIGFGGLDKRLLERNREETIQYDIATNIDVGKLLPKGAKLTIPMYTQYSKTLINPEYDPFDQDINLKEKLNIIPNEDFKDEVNERSRKSTTIKTFNLTNVKTQAGGTGKPWSPSNFNVSYAYTETEKTDPIIESDLTVNRSIGLDYVYSRKSKYIQPFKGLKSSYLKPIADFNFSLLPSNFSFISRMIDYKNTRTFRQPETPVFIFDDLRFNWERNYVLDWDFTKSIRFNYRANTNSIVDQLRQVGINDNPDDRDYVDEYNNPYAEASQNPSVVNTYKWNNIKKLGRSKNYTHSASLSYRLPFKSFPILDWINASADYRAGYTWEGGSLITIDQLTPPTFLGNTISNNVSGSFNATLSLDRLYGKWGYLKSIETGKANPKKKSDRKKQTPKNVSKDDPKGKGGGKEQEEDIMKGIEKLSVDGSDDEIAGKDGKNSKKEEKKADKPRVPTLAERIIIRPLLSLRSVKFNYKDDRNTVIPGFMPQSSLLGLSEGFEAPGFDFIAGFQPNLQGENNNWLIKNQQWFNASPNFNSALSQTKRQTVDAKILIEPFKDFSIDVTMKRSRQENHTEVFRTKGADGEFMQLAQYDIGSFDVTYWGFYTLFDNSLDIYDVFKKNKEIIARRLPNIANPGVHPSDPSYVEGYGPTHNLVNIPAFISAYTKQSPYKVNLDQKSVFTSNTYIPKPNWQINYNGLSRMKAFSNVFANFTIRHGYSSTLKVNNYETQPNYSSSQPFGELSPNQNYYSQLEISAVNLSEQFVPLIGVSVKTKKDMKFDFEFKQSRLLDLTLSTLREQKSKEITVGAGYTIKMKKTSKKKKKKKVEDDDDSDDKKPSLLGSLTKSNKSATQKTRDIRINFAYSYRDDYTQIYNLLTGTVPQADRGGKTITLSPNIEYDVNKNLSLRWYFDYNKTIPYTTLSFTNTTLRSGITLKFNIN